jgi:hypothetical protein
MVFIVENFMQPFWKYQVYKHLRSVDSLPSLLLRFVVINTSSHAWLAEATLDNGLPEPFLLPIFEEN